MEQYLEVQGFDFSVVPVEKRERAKELDIQCGTAIQKLSYTVDEIGEICIEMGATQVFANSERRA
jgi:hypothetical protein